MGPGSGAVVTNGAAFEAEDCLFYGSQDVAIEARAGAQCVLRRCQIEDCNVQAVLIHKGGSEAVLLDCKVERCGALPAAAALHAACGKATIRRCLIRRNRGDDVTMEDEDQTAHLDVSYSEITTNGGQGIAIYGGHASCSDNRINENAGVGLMISDNDARGNPFWHVAAIRNHFSRNGTPPGQILVCTTGSSQSLYDRVTLKSNSDATGTCVAHCIAEDDTPHAYMEFMGRRQNRETFQGIYDAADHVTTYLDASTGMPLGCGVRVEDGHRRMF